MSSSQLPIDIAIIGAGAAGLAASIFAAESSGSKTPRIVLIESAKKPGAKILVSGGGRCNVTNTQVSERDFWGGSPAIIRNVLRQFDERAARAWFERMGVRLKLEATGKYFPTTDKAQTVLDALLKSVQEHGVEWVTERVTDIIPRDHGYELTMKRLPEPTFRAGSGVPSPSQNEALTARRVIVATGGMSLPKTGSDGAGLAMMRRLGHTIVPTTPALTGLVLQKGRHLGGRFAEFAGMSFEARLTLRNQIDGDRSVSLEGDLLFTHFGVSGPVAMNMSRHWERATTSANGSDFVLEMAPIAFNGPSQVAEWIKLMRDERSTEQMSDILSQYYPARFVAALVAEAGGDVTLAQLTKAQSDRFASIVGALPLTVTGTRGYAHAEATAGGVDLSEINWHTMESRKVPGLFLCGEILDVDGRIGGFNFQWAWSSGYIAGRGAVSTSH